MCVCVGCFAFDWCCIEMSKQQGYVIDYSNKAKPRSEREPYCSIKKIRSAKTGITFKTIILKPMPYDEDPDVYWGECCQVLDAEAPPAATATADPIQHTQPGAAMGSCQCKLCLDYQAQIGFK